MSVNGIGTAGYPLTGYTARKMGRSVEPGTVGFMDAAKEVNANGMGIRGNGMMSHISQMMVQRLNKQLKKDAACILKGGNVIAVVGYKE